MTNVDERSLLSVTVRSETDTDLVDALMIVDTPGKVEEILVAEALIDGELSCSNGGVLDSFVAMDFPNTLEDMATLDLVIVEGSRERGEEARIDVDETVLLSATDTVESTIPLDETLTILETATSVEGRLGTDITLEERDGGDDGVDEAPATRDDGLLDN